MFTVDPYHRFVHCSDACLSALSPAPADRSAALAPLIIVVVGLVAGALLASGRDANSSASINRALSRTLRREARQSSLRAALLRGGAVLLVALTLAALLHH